MTGPGDVRWHGRSPRLRGGRGGAQVPAGLTSRVSLNDQGHAAVHVELGAIGRPETLGYWAAAGSLQLHSPVDKDLRTRPFRAHLLDDRPRSGAFAGARRESGI